MQAFPDKKMADEELIVLVQHKRLPGRF